MEEFLDGGSVLRAHKLLDVLVMAAKRLLDLSPPAALVLLFTGVLLWQVVGAALLAAFVFAVVRHRVLDSGMFVGRLVVRLFYVPSYRFLRAAGFIGGLLYSLAGRGWARVETTDPTELNRLVAEFSG